MWPTEKGVQSPTRHAKYCNDARSGPVIYDPSLQNMLEFCTATHINVSLIFINKTITTVLFNVTSSTIIIDTYSEVVHVDAVLVIFLKRLFLISEQFFGATICVLTMTTIANVLVMNAHFRGLRGHRPPAWVRKLFFEWLARIVCMHKVMSTTRLDFGYCSKFS